MAKLTQEDLEKQRATWTKKDWDEYNTTLAAMKLPTFRHMVKAIGDHKNPDKTMRRYHVVEFRPHGGFIRLPDLFITNTKMRMKKQGTSVYETSNGFTTTLIDAAQFRLYKNAWDQIRVANNLTVVDDEGN